MNLKVIVMKEGSFVKINYVGRVKDSGEIFDLTYEDLARKEGIYNPNFKYGPVSLIVGAGFVIKGLDEALLEMKVKEKRKIEVLPEKAFGERNENLIKLLPLSIFKERNIDVKPGNFVRINGINGRVISIDGGRVKIDFNHPLAGKILEYEVEILEEILEIGEKVKSIIEYFCPDCKENYYELEFNEGRVTIKLKEKRFFGLDVRERIASSILKWIEEIKRVEFLESYEKNILK